MIEKVMLVRVAQGYSAYKFAALVGVHPNWWREIERGQRKPSTTVASKAAKILGHTVDGLFVDAPESVGPTRKRTKVVEV